MVKLRQRKLIVSDCSSYLWWYCVNLLTVNIIRVKSTEHRLPVMFYKCKCWTLGSFPVVVVASRRRSGTRCVYLWRWSCTWNIVCLVCRLSFLLGSWFCKKNKIIKMVLYFFAVFGDGSLPKRSGRKINQHCWSFCSRHTSSLDPVEGEAGPVVCLMALFAACCYTPAKSVRSVAWRGLQSQLEVAGVIWDRKAPDRQKPTQWHRQTGNHTHAHTHCYTRLRTRQVQDRLIH